MIHGYLGGQAGASAMADALTGRINPCGKLSETWPLKLSDNPSYGYYPSSQRTSEYREGMYTGYRYYDTKGVRVRYPFGYGLSYTVFSYSDIQADAGHVTFTLTNTGKRDGSEICQVYVSCLDGRIARPQKELKGFTKVFLAAGETIRVSVRLDDKAFRYFNTLIGRWETESGRYMVSVAASVSDVKLSCELSIKGTGETAVPEIPACYRTGDISNVSDSDFAALLGRGVPDGAWSGELKANDAICQLYYARSGIGRLAWKILTRLKKSSEAKGKPSLNIMFIYNMPFRAMWKMSGGLVSGKMVDDIVFLVNGHFLRGTGRLIRDFLKNRKSNKEFLRVISE